MTGYLNPENTRLYGVVFDSNRPAMPMRLTATEVVRLMSMGWKIEIKK